MGLRNLRVDAVPILGCALVIGMIAGGATAVGSALGFVVYKGSAAVGASVLALAVPVAVAGVLVAAAVALVTKDP